MPRKVKRRGACPLFKRLAIRSRVKRRKAEHIIIIVGLCGTLISLSRFDGQKTISQKTARAVTRLSYAIILLNIGNGGGTLSTVTMPHRGAMRGE